MISARGGAGDQVEDGVADLALPVVGGLSQHPDVDHQAALDLRLPGQAAVGAHDHLGAAGAGPGAVLAGR